jgi:glycine cleavage system aminomethyltransferase T
MAINSPIHTLHEQAEATVLPFGADGAIAQVVETYGEIEAEYAAIRRGCLILDLPHRATVRVTGKDRVEFLNRMLTQELKGLQPFQTRRSFWLNRKGRIDADLRLVQLPEHMLIDVDILGAAKTVSTLTEFIFSEEVAFENATASRHRLALHGPRGIELLRAVSHPAGGPPLADLAEAQACIVTVGGHEVIVERDDSTGDPGLELNLDAAHAPTVDPQVLDHDVPHQMLFVETGKV